LLELMVVVGIIAILAAVAVPAWETFRRRAALTAMVAEISRAKQPTEIRIMEGMESSNDPTDGGLVSPSAICTDIIYSVSCSPGSSSVLATITCYKEDLAAILRYRGGAWSCVTEFGWSGGVGHDPILWSPRGCTGR
jgi:type IV pilus assembly protein PilA